MNAHHPQPPSQAASPAQNADERLADLRRRRAEAADVLAEALLELWRREQRVKRAAAASTSRGGAS